MVLDTISVRQDEGDEEWHKLPIEHRERVIERQALGAPEVCTDAIVIRPQAIQKKDVTFCPGVRYIVWTLCP